MKKIIIALAASTAALASASSFAARPSQEEIAPYYPNTLLVADTAPGSTGQTIGRPVHLTQKTLDEAARSRSAPYIIYSSPQTGSLSQDDVFFGH